MRGHSWMLALEVFTQKKMGEIMEVKKHEASLERKEQKLNLEAEATLGIEIGLVLAQKKPLGGGGAITTLFN